MSNKIWDEVRTGLWLNGPTLSITSSPSDTTVCAGSNATFTVSGQASFPSGESGISTDGTLVYEWYDGSTKLGISTFWSGQDGTTLTLLHPESPGYNGKQYRCRVTYTPSAYGSAGAGAAKSTGNAINDEVYSDYATLTVLPTLEIQAGPSSVTSAINQEATFTTTATVTDNSNIQYRWQVNGSDVTDGTSSETSSAQRFTNNYERGDMSNNVASITIPDDATNVKIRVAGGAGRQGDTCQNGAGGAAGQGRSGTFSIADGGRILDLYVGDRSNSQQGGEGANSEGGDGGDGDEGTQGWYPANDGTRSVNVPVVGGIGGGGGAGVFVYDRSSSTYIISAGAGGGGGGGSENDGGNTGSDAGDWQSISGDVSASGDGGAAGAGGELGQGSTASSPRQRQQDSRMIWWSQNPANNVQAQ